MTITDRIAGLNQGVALKAPCRVVTTAEVVLYGLQTINGVALAAGDRVLVKDQSNTVQNGIWVASATAWARAKDFNGPRDAVKGTLVYAGAPNDGAFYSLQTPDPVMIGTGAITFIPFLFADPADVAALLAIAADISTVAGIETDVTTVAGIALDVSAVVALTTEVQALAAVVADIAALGPIASAVSTVAGLAAQVTTVSGIEAEVQAVAAVASNIPVVASITADISAVAAVSTEVAALGAISADISTVAGMTGNVATVAGIAGAVSAVAAIDADISTVAANLTAINGFNGALPYFTGGTNGQVLQKGSNADYDFEWVTLPGGGDLVSTNNLSDVASPAAALANLGGVPSTRTINGAALSANVTLTTNNIADVSDKRYMTNAERTSILNLAALAFKAKAQAGDIDSQTATAGQVLTANGSGGAAFQNAVTGKVLKYGYAENTANTVCNTSIPLDNTTPEITEGVEILTLSFTPASATSKLLITAQAKMGASSSNVDGAFAAFSDSTCIDAGLIKGEYTGQDEAQFFTQFLVDANNTTARTISVRVGRASGSFVLNSNDTGTAVFNGKSKATLTVLELGA